MAKRTRNPGTKRKDLARYRERIASEPGFADKERARHAAWKQRNRESYLAYHRMYHRYGSYRDQRAGGGVEIFLP